ncbi:MAG: pilin [Pseudomonadota bacterium]
MHRSLGFGLIELMIVVASVAALAAIALPAYQIYAVRSQVAEGFSVASGARDAVVTYYGERGSFPPSNGDAGMPPPDTYSSRYLSSVSVTAAGQIEIPFAPSAHALIAGQTLVLEAHPAGGSISWTCSGLDSRLLPAPCRP